MKPLVIKVKDLSAGLSRMLGEFESTLRSDESARWEESDYNLSKQAAASRRQKFEAAKQKLLRKLKRIENGPDIAHIEQIKRDFRKMSHAIVEKAIDGTVDPEMFKMAQDIVSGRKRL